MKKIPLTRGKFAIVDDEDYDYLMQWKWRFSNNGYAERNEKSENVKKLILMHRELNKTPCGLMTDHINGDGIDNRKCNLRTASNSQNQKNANKQNRKTSSKYKGVSWNKQNRRWRVRVGHEYIGSFRDEKEAARAYNNEAKIAHGQFAKLNQGIT